MQAKLPEAFEAAAGHRGEVHGRRTVTAHAMGAQSEVPVVVNIRILGALYAGKASAKQARRQLFNPGHFDFLLVQVRPLSLDGCEELAAYWLQDHAHDQFACFLKPEGNRETWVPVSKIGRAIEGIHVPAEG